ncbi:citrulline utilization hydrolase CtlX [Olivibacter sp. XZL3]|uniref:citrulline utilization hydrolase CtlX n=1 Tax=Olivibacter sp. XZL3 TaxID=1735116 RepID=UPI0010653FEB|nr:arginine deiminase-related protein [Olivibacter sp. XZL3]
MNLTSAIMMIRPLNFNYNEETAVNNKFQQVTSGADMQTIALNQFEGFVSLLEDHDVDVHVFEDTKDPIKPDAIFPNNWLSFHEDGSLVLYPLFAKNRRKERRRDIIDLLSASYELKNIIDLTHFEQKQLFLEGTGSMVLDRKHHIAFMCKSPRSSTAVLYEFCKRMDYKPIYFEASDRNGFPIYHTNVMMCVGNDFAVICKDALTSSTDKEKVIKSLTQTGKEIVDISFGQMEHFAGNMIQLKNKLNQALLVMSEQAYLSLHKEQRTCLKKRAQLLYAPLDVIEKNGGGSARCMITEIFSPPKKRYLTT